MFKKYSVNSLKRKKKKLTPREQVQPSAWTCRESRYSTSIDTLVNFLAFYIFYLPSQVLSHKVCGILNSGNGFLKSYLLTTKTVVAFYLFMFILKEGSFLLHQATVIIWFFNVYNESVKNWWFVSTSQREVLDPPRDQLTPYFVLHLNLFLNLQSFIKL